MPKVIVKHTTGVPEKPFFLMTGRSALTMRFALPQDAEAWAIENELTGDYRICSESYSVTLGQAADDFMRTNCRMFGLNYFVRPVGVRKRVTLRTVAEVSTVD